MDPDETGVPAAEGTDSNIEHEGDDTMTTEGESPSQGTDGEGQVEEETAAL